MTDKTKENIKFGITLLTGISAILSIWYYRKSAAQLEATILASAKKAEQKLV